jgi:hypothetical protein
MRANDCEGRASRDGNRSPASEARSSVGGGREQLARRGMFAPSERAFRSRKALSSAAFVSREFRLDQPPPPVSLAALASLSSPASSRCDSRWRSFLRAMEAVGGWRLWCSGPAKFARTCSNAKRHHGSLRRRRASARRRRSTHGAITRAHDNAKAPSRDGNHSPASEAKRGSRRSSGGEIVGGGGREQLARRGMSVPSERAFRSGKALSSATFVSGEFPLDQPPPSVSLASLAIHLP